ncbi:hypothetical protein ACEWY4_016667 [Coilia grayii]|uniref:Uncharacterized protein n=1 Tax=Coilia grayii TaxID=363190 RepID=A0ABD1JL80_9TELE
MGAAQSIPVVGEVVTAIDSGVKITAAGVCGVIGGLLDDEDAKDTAMKLVKDAGKSWVEYSERNIIIAPTRAVIHDIAGNTKEAKRVLCKMGKSVEELADSTPVVGHVKGVYHYLDGDKEHGDACMKGASRTLVVVGAGALTGGIGGGVALGGLAGVGSGFGYDVAVSAGERRPNGLIGSIDNAVESLKERDLHGFMDSAINLGYGFTGDFLAGAGGAKASKQLNKASQQRSALRKEIGKSATNDTVDAAKHLKKVQKKVSGEGHVCTKVKNLETGDTAYGTNERCRQQIRVNEYTRNGEASGYNSRTNAMKGRVGEFPREPGILENRANERGVLIEQRVQARNGGYRAVNACAEHEAFEKLQTTGADNRVRTTSVQYRDGSITTVERCDNCAQFADLMGDVPTDRVPGITVPTRQFILDSSTRAVGGAAAYAGISVVRPHRILQYHSHNH